VAESSAPTEDRAYVIVNPNAGKKFGLTTNAFGLDEARALVERHGIVADVRCTERAGHATELARDAARDGYRLGIAAGGAGAV